MTTLKVNAIEPEGATTNLAVGMTGQNVVVGGSGGIKVNTMKDAGGNTLFTSNGSGVLSSVSGFGGAQVLLSTTTVSSAVANISFTSGMSSTYKEYIFDFINIQPVTDATYWSFQANASGQSGFNETIQSTSLRTYHSEADGGNTGAPHNDLVYQTNFDQANGTSYQTLTADTANDADGGLVGELHIFNPASTTYVKHFYAKIQLMHNANYTEELYTSGYINVTAAITQIDFKFNSGNIAAGKIKMYGVK